VTLAAIAVVFGLVTAYGAKRILETKPAAEKVVEAPKLPMVPVAQVNLTPYSRIAERDVLLMEASSEEFLKDALPNTQRALGRLVKSTILAGRPIRNADLYEAGTVPQMADQLPAGYRAVTLKVDDAIASNGAILSGSFVDIDLTFDSDHPEIDGTATVNLLRRLKVLAPSPAKDSKDAVFQGQGGKTNITVAATPEEANRLILAQQYGTINVTLCSNNDKDSLALADGNRNLINKTDLLGLPPIPPPPAPPVLPVPEPPIRKVVEIYHGSQIQQVVFNEAGELLSTEAAGEPEVEPVTANSQPQPNAVGPAKTAKKCATCGKKKKNLIHFGPSAGNSAPSSSNQSGAAGDSVGSGGVGQPTLAPGKPTPPPPTPDGL